MKFITFLRVYQSATDEIPFWGLSTENVYKIVYDINKSGKRI